MLHSLDTLIGFAVIMTILSLLITVGTQMLSSALSLRGKNLANALAVTLRTIDPEIGEHAEAVVAHVLSRPGISDSIFSPTKLAATTPSAAVLTDIAMANHLLAVQDARNSAQATLASVQTAFDDAENALAAAQVAAQSATGAALTTARAAYAACLADSHRAAFDLRAAQAAARPLILNYALARAQVPAPAAVTESGRFWNAFGLGGFQFSTAIRADEVYRILHELAALTPAEAAARNLHPLVPWKLTNLLNVVGTAGVPAKEAADKVAATLKLVGLGNTVQAGEALIEHTELLGKEIKVAVAQGFDRFQRWFDSSQDRAQQWFSTHTQIITIILAFAIAIGLELDVREIYIRISSDQGLRSELLGKAQNVIAQGEQALEARKTPEMRALEVWLTSHPSVTVPTPNPLTRDGYVAAIRTAVPADQADTAQKAFEDELDKLASADLQSEAGTFQSLVSDLGGSGFELIPTYPRWKEGRSGHWLGMLFMSALLSIGAPFWFNILKSLTNLRPTMSQLIDEKPTQTPAVPAKT